MGDRFYMQQKAANGKGGKNGPKKPPRKLKKDIILAINTFLDSELEGLEKMTIANLEALLDSIKKFALDLEQYHTFN